MVCGVPGVRGVECGLARSITTKREKNIFVSMNHD